MEYGYGHHDEKGLHSERDLAVSPRILLNKYNWDRVFFFPKYFIFTKYFILFILPDASSISAWDFVIKGGKQFGSSVTPAWHQFGSGYAWDREPPVLPGAIAAIQFSLQKLLLDVDNVYVVFRLNS